MALQRIPGITAKDETISQGGIWEVVGMHWGKHGAAVRAQAAAVLLAESGGRTLARNVNRDGSVDRGPWQINNRAHPNVTDQCAYDLGCSTAAAYRIWQAAGNSFSPWVAFTNGSYKKYLGEVTIDDASVEEQGTAKITRALDKVNPLDNIWDIVSKLDVIFQGDFWRRVGLVLGGSIALIIGAYLIGREYMPTIPAPVTAVAGKAAGKAVSAVRPS